MTNPNSKAGGNPSSPPSPAPERLPPIVELLLSGIANLKYAITGKSDDAERR